jgi:hypothetical protein
MKWTEMPYTEEAMFYPYTLVVYVCPEGYWSSRVMTLGHDCHHLGYFATKETAREAARSYLQRELSELLVSLATKEE